MQVVALEQRQHDYSHQKGCVSLSTTTQVAEVRRKWYKSIQESGEAIAIQADVRDREHVEHMVAEAQAQFGPVDILVSNAAMSFVQKPIKELTWEEVSQKLNDDISKCPEKWFWLTLGDSARLLLVHR